MNASLIAARLTAEYGLAPRPSWRAEIERWLRSWAEKGLTASAAAERTLNDGGRLRALAGRLTVNEAHFFRHEQQFPALVSHVRRCLADAERVKICSIGCAHGEEPYSIGIALAEELSAPDLDRVVIEASDLSPEAIELAAAGVFTSWSGRGLSAARRRRHFRALPQGRIEIAASLRRRIQFLSEAAREHVRALSPGSVQAIFFRNVAIYLESPMLEELYSAFATALAPDGLLFTGPADPAPSRTLLPLADAEASVYRRPPREQQAPVAAPVPGKAPDELRSPIEVLSAQADRGDLAGALARLEQLRESDVLGHLGVLHGQISLAAGAPERGLANLARAVFDAPEDLVARFWFALLLLHLQAPQRALFQLNTVIDHLSGLEHGATLPDGATAADLLAAAMEIREQIT